MADNNTPARSDMDDASFGSEQGTVPDSESSRARTYRDAGDNAGGISNRPLDEEVENQEALPERGSGIDEERTGGNEDIER